MYHKRKAIQKIIYRKSDVAETHCIVKVEREDEEYADIISGKYQRSSRFDQDNIIEKQKKGKSNYRMNRSDGCVLEETRKYKNERDMQLRRVIEMASNNGE